MTCSSTSAFGSPFFSGPTTMNAFVGCPSPFPFRPFTDDRSEERMMVSISAKPAYKDISHEELRWEHHHHSNAAGGRVVPPFAGNHSTCPSPIFPFTSNPFSTPVTPPLFGHNSFLNHVKKANLEFVLSKMGEWEKSTQLICRDVKRFQEDMKSWIEIGRSLELEKIEATQTISRLREELAHVTRSKDAIIAEYLASPDFTEIVDEEHEKRLSKIFHPCYVKALGAVQTKLSEINSYYSQRTGFGQRINPNVSSTGSSGPHYPFGPASNHFGSRPGSGGTSTGLFRGSLFGQNNNLFGSPPNNGGRSSFGQSNNVFGSAPGSGGTSTGLFGGNPFGQSNNLFGSAPNNGGGSSFEQNNNLFVSAPNNGGTSTDLFGGSSFGQSNNLLRSAPDNDGGSSFGQSNNFFASSANNGGTSTSFFEGSSFGQNNNLFKSAPNNGGTVFGESPFGQSSNLFGSAPNNGGTLTGVFWKSSFDQSSNLSQSAPNNIGTSMVVPEGSLKLPEMDCFSSQRPATYPFPPLHSCSLVTTPVSATLEPCSLVTTPVSTTLEPKYFKTKEQEGKN
ncbi:uncharacterized protein LOC141668254 [Apium graveolens]|uniref:uncharacterized protein LOC141668254 n=1 Tax=Apium graveolens TaxID=4045 RepID=UPI003D79EC6A